MTNAEIDAASVKPDAVPVGSGELVRLSSLFMGDRYIDAKGTLWTHCGHIGDGKNIHARRHSEESVALGERGYGYIGDAICSWPLDEYVRFQRPTKPNAEISGRGEKENKT